MKLEEGEIPYIADQEEGPRGWLKVGPWNLEVWPAQDRLPEQICRLDCDFCGKRRVPASFTNSILLIFTVTTHLT